MACWGFQRVANLIPSYSVVLPSFIHVLQYHHEITNHEVLLSIQRLIKKFGKDVSQFFLPLL